MTQVQRRLWNLWLLSAVAEINKSGTREAVVEDFRVNAKPNPSWNLSYLEWIRVIMNV